MRFFVHHSSSPHSIYHHPAATVLLELLAWFGLCVVVTKTLTWIWRRTTQRSTFNYIPMGTNLTNVVVTDCTAPKSVPTLTHHKGHNNPHNLRKADTSTGLVLNAINAGYWFGGDVYLTCQLPSITTNHFDVDSFLAVWCYTNRQQAKDFEPVLRHMSRIGDFREAFLSPELVGAFGAEDNVTSIREAFTALKLVCWLNTLEKRLFSAPFESKDCEEKFHYFLPRFGQVLVDPEPCWVDWQDEYTQVVGGFDQLVQGDSSVELVKKVGLAVVQCHEPLHYYSLFSHTHGCDVVLSMYDHNRYEVECKYTQFVEVWSRPVWPRLDMTPLADVLTRMEAPGALPPGVVWQAVRFTEPGPILRLTNPNQPLTKAQLYGHPYDRPFINSSLPAGAVAAVVQSFLEYGLQRLHPMRGGWTWDQLRDINTSINWRTWSEAVLSQHQSGELSGLLSEGSGQLKHPLLSRRTSTSADDGGVVMDLPLGPLHAFLPQMTDHGSSIMSRDDIAALVTSGALPARYRSSPWELVYCTTRDGISLHTLYRRAAGRSPTVLVVKDAGGGVFGAFCPEAWHIGPRFYGTGETCVFKLQPERMLYTWQKPRVQGDHNDFFQFSTHEGLGIGGVGHFAIWIDNDLFEGSSSQCLTFRSPCLASSPEFHVQAVELWHLH